MLDERCLFSALQTLILNAFLQVFVINKKVYLTIKHIVYILSLHK